MTILRFAFNSGFKTGAIRALREWPNKQKDFPWEIGLELLNHCNEKLNDQESELVTSILTFYQNLASKKMRFVRLLRQPCLDESGDQYLIVRFNPNID